MIFSKICHYKDEQKKYFTMTILFWDGLDGRDGLNKTGKSKASRAPACKRFFENQLFRCELEHYI